MKSTLFLLSLIFFGSVSFASYFSYDSAKFHSVKDTAGKFHRSFEFKGPINYHSTSGNLLPVSAESNSLYVCSALTGLSWRNQISSGSNYISSFSGFGPIRPTYTNFDATALIGEYSEIERVVYQNDRILQNSVRKGANLGMSDISCNYVD